MRYQFETLILALALAPTLTSNVAYARLGEASQKASADSTRVSGSTVTTESHNNCYKIIHIDAPGRHIKEYVNAAQDQVFMVAAVSRVKMNLSQLLTDDDLKELQSAPRKTKAPLSKTHNHQGYLSETERLKVRSSADSGVFRNVMILKSAVPTSCVSNPESLL